MSVLRTQGMYPSFVRSGKETRSTHYCPGCGHGILHKLVTEALVELGIAERTVIVNPIGCAVFGYYYFDCGNVVAPHGRAPCVATALARGRPEAVVVSYQGDGDLGSIGFNHCFQAASRGEGMATFFVNNATYGMTGGQMAPTTLPGMRTQTSPLGRDLRNDGYPLHVCEVLDTLEAPVYIERCSLADPKRIMTARRAVRRALEIQRDGQGYAFVEFLSPCPTNMGMDSLKAAAWVAEELEREFPLKRFRDRGSGARAEPRRTDAVEVNEYFRAIGRPGDGSLDEDAAETRMVFSGSGGQGVLSLGMAAAEAGMAAGRRATWFPSYGPEQRGGAASCSVVLSGREIGAPSVDRPDVLVCMNRPSFERFHERVAPGGLLIVDELAGVNGGWRTDLRAFIFPATDVAASLNLPKAANVAMLGALYALVALPGIEREHYLSAIKASFASKPALIPANLRVFEAAESLCAERYGRGAGRAGSMEREAVLA